MIQFFGIPLDNFTNVLLNVTLVIVISVIALALLNALFFKIGIRNIVRRRTQMLLIVCALMLSTTFLSSVLATGDVLTSAVQSVAVYNWGNIDEDIEGGSGSSGLFSERLYNRLVRHAGQMPDVNAISAVFREQDLLIADETSRQVRSSVTALGVVPGSERGFGGLQDATTKVSRPVSALSSTSVYMNQTAAQLLNAKAGDTLYIYSQRWPGQRQVFHIEAIVANTDIIGDSPTLITQISVFQTIEKKPGMINQIYVENRGGGGVNGVHLSNTVTRELQHYLPRYVHVIQVKQNGVQVSQQAEDIFSRIFDLFALFSLAIGLLLIFLIFILLAAERRTEMGMARAIGVQRRHIIMMYLFEGTVYDLLASFVGLFLGLGVGTLIITLLQPLLARFNFPLKFTIQPHSLIIAYCLGVIFTFCAVVISSWIVSRMTVIEAIRDLPEPVYVDDSLRGLIEKLAILTKQIWTHGISTRRNWKRIRWILSDTLPEMILSGFRFITLVGGLPLLLGYWLLQIGLSDLAIVPFSLGLSLILLGSGLLLKALIIQVVRWRYHVAHLSWEDGLRRWSRILNGLLAAAVGLLLMAYWALPFDALQELGLPRFQGGIEVFFVAAIMMILGTVWALTVNGRLLAAPFLAACSHFPDLYVLSRLALAYPLQRRFRTGLSVIMFGLVVFAMTVMVIITNAMQNSYASISSQTGGYNIQATAYFKTVSNLQDSLAAHDISPQSFSSIGVERTTAAGIVQLSAPDPRWSVYPVQLISGGFLQGYGLHLTARASGLNSDAAVWQALQTHPDYALIDSSALSSSPGSNPLVPGSMSFDGQSIPPDLLFSLSGVASDQSSFTAVPVWVAGFDEQKSVSFTIIGVVDNSDNAHSGLYVPATSYSQESLGGLYQTDNNPSSLNYYLKVAPGQDERSLSLALGSAYLDNGFETTVLEDAIWQTRGPRIFLSDVLLGVVALTLLLGVMALALTGTRAVIERRQQIGMLRAMGSSRYLIQGAFLLESFIVGAAGSLLGCVLGLILSRNIFAANFFEQYQTGLFFSVPWQQLSLVIGISFAASFIGALLPAWQAGRVSPAEALRYS